MGTRSITVIGAGIAGRGNPRGRWRCGVPGSPSLNRRPRSARSAPACRSPRTATAGDQALGLGLAAEQEEPTGGGGRADRQRNRRPRRAYGGPSAAAPGRAVPLLSPRRPGRPYGRGRARRGGNPAPAADRGGDAGRGRRLRTAQGAEIETDILIGADGLHSRVREALNGKVAPFFTHQVAWRATLPAEPDIRPVARIFMGAGRHVVTYPLAQQASQPCRRRGAPPLGLRKAGR